MTRIRNVLAALVATTLVAVTMTAVPARALGAPRDRAAVRCALSTDSTLLQLQASGQTFTDFLAAAKARREGWLRLADSAQVDEALLARARAVGGTWRVLVVAIDACGDSMNSVPYLAKLAASVPGIDLRIVLPVNGRAVQSTHRSMDGRQATPTIVLLDSTGRDVGCIVELPQGIRRWAHGVRSSVSSDSLHAGIRAFYAKDRGRGITTEMVELLEAAKQGQMVCERGPSQ
jgi:Thioredoxin